MSNQYDSDSRLFGWYRAYIGEPDSEIDVYLGFALFFGAIGLGAGALLVFIVGQLTAIETFTWRKPSFALGMVSLPMALASVIVLLPVDRRGLIGGGIGGLICLAAIFGFLLAYPDQWDVGSGETYSLEVMFTYSVGIAIMLASTGGALVAYHVERARPHPAEIEASETEQTESYSDEEIQDDIEQAMEEVDLTWGGVEKTDNTSLDLQMDDHDIDTSGMQMQVTRVKSESVDQQVDGLKAVKGGDKKTARSETTVDDQTAQLKELRKRKESEDPIEEEKPLESIVGRIRAFFGSN